MEGLTTRKEIEADLAAHQAHMHTIISTEAFEECKAYQARLRKQLSAFEGVAPKQA